MNRGVKILVLVSAVLIVHTIALSSACFAQKIEIELVHQGNDVIGQRVAFQIREIIQKSSTMVPYAGKEPWWFKVILQTGASGTEKQNSSSCYSGVLVLCNKDAATKATTEIYLTSWLGVCSTQRVREAAESIIAAISSEVDSLHKKGSSK